MLFPDHGSALFCLRVEKGLHNLQDAVNPAPDNIGQAAAVPETADQKREQKIQAVPETSHPAAAKRNVDIIAKPGGEGDVPTAPKFPDGEGKIGVLEVGHKLDAEKSGTADGDVRVAGKVAVDLDGKHHRGDDEDKAHIAVGIVVHFVHHCGENIRNHQFFEIPPGHQFQPVGHVFVVKTALRFQLRQEGVRPSDGAGQKLREEGDKEGVIAEMPLRLTFSPVYVDEIPHRLEEIEGNACGQQDFYRQRLHGQASRVNQGVQSVDHGRAQFEDKKNAHKGQDAAKQTAPFGRFVRRPFQTQGQHIGEHGGKQEQKPVSHMQVHIEDIACRQQENPSVFARYNMIQDKSRK